MSKPGDGRPARKDYVYFHDIQTRWADNDVYGHINNVVYYSFFDTAVNAYLIDRCGLDIEGGEVIGLVVETGCRYFESLAYPEAITVGVRVARLGNSSVVYETAIFRKEMDLAAAEGRFVHVYVDRQTRRPTPLPPLMREGLAALEASGAK